MAERHQVYKCEICGNIVELLHGGKGTLVCCGEPMILLEEHTADWKNEKHVPMVEKTDDGIKVTVGSTLHPMTDEHWIEWIEIIVDGKVYKEFLNPGDKPEVMFNVTGDKIIAREHCNIHGLWKNDMS